MTGSTAVWMGVSCMAHLDAAARRGEPIEDQPSVVADGSRNRLLLSLGMGLMVL